VYALHCLTFVACVCMTVCVPLVCASLFYAAIEIFRRIKLIIKIRQGSPAAQRVPYISTATRLSCGVCLKMHDKPGQ